MGELCLWLQNGKHDEAWMVLKQVHDTNMRAKGHPERVFSVSRSPRVVLHGPPFPALPGPSLKTAPTFPDLSHHPLPMCPLLGNQHIRPCLHFAAVGETEAPEWGWEIQTV